MCIEKTPPAMPPSIAAILMASGFSKRFGEGNKLLAPFRGKPLARHTLELVSQIHFPGGIFFIAANDNVAALAAGLPAVTVIRNRNPEKGLRESVRLGVEAAPAAAHYLFFPCDQPLLDIATVKLVMAAARQGCIVEPRHRGRPGNPCLFCASFREALLSLEEGQSPRGIKAASPGAVIPVEAQNPLALEDADTEESLARLSAGRV
ncbi:MAG: nucleotidyltransferase family protein [Spirochaetes bacterium]|nr:nucleotidyltransferase family protein [Spirochaetota bacterium]